MTAPKRSPLRMFLPFLVVVALFALWSIYWLVAIRLAETTATGERQRLASLGLTLACANETWGGYPFRIEFTCENPTVTTPRVTFAAARILAVAQAYNPFHVVTLLDGPSTLTAAGREPVVAMHGRAILSVSVSGTQLSQLSAEVGDISVPDQFTVRDILIHARPSASGDYDLAIDLTAIAVTPPGEPTLALDLASFRGTVSAPSQLKIDSLAAEAGTVRASAAGTVLLDSAHRPEGKITVETNDAKGLIALIGPHLALSDQQNAAIKAFLVMVGNTPKLDITAQDGALFVGPIPAGKLRPLY